MKVVLEIPLSHLNIAKPNNFMLATNSLYLTSHKICNLTIYDPSYGEIKMYSITNYIPPMRVLHKAVSFHLLLRT